MGQKSFYTENKVRARKIFRQSQFIESIKVIDKPSDKFSSSSKASDHFQ